MKNNRIVKTLQWGIGGMLILLLGLGTILLPLSTNTVHAANVQIRDDARVLDVDQVRSQASQLSHSVSISTMRTFSGPKSDFIRSTEQALTGQNAIAIAIGIAVEQRYLAIVAGKQAGLNAEQIEQARQAFAKAYGSNAGANGNYTGATLAALQSLQASLGNDGILNPPPSLGRVLGNPLTWLLLLALIGGAFFVFRRFSGQRNRMNSPMGMPWQERPGPKDEYGRVDSDAGYGQPGYGRPPYHGSGYDPNGYGGPTYCPRFSPQKRMKNSAPGGAGGERGGVFLYVFWREDGGGGWRAHGSSYTKYFNTNS